MLGHYIQIRGTFALYTFRVRAKGDCIGIFPCGLFIAKTCANHFDTCISRQHAHACKNNRTCAVCPSTLIVIQHPTVSLRCPSHRLQNPLISARAGDPRLARGSTACKTCGKSRFRRPAVEKWFIKVLKGEIVGGSMSLNMVELNEDSARSNSQDGDDMGFSGSACD